MDCWVWNGGTRAGYGQVSSGGSTHAAHRLSYEVFVAPLLAGEEIHHLCEEPRCLNPWHLVPVTRAEHKLIHWGEPMAEKRRGGTRVTVYLRVEDEQKLKAQGKDPAAWVKGLVRHALTKV